MAVVGEVLPCEREVNNIIIVFVRCLSPKISGGRKFPEIRYVASTYCTLLLYVNTVLVLAYAVHTVGSYTCTVATELQYVRTYICIVHF